MECINHQTGEVFDVASDQYDRMVIDKKYDSNESKIKRFILLNQVRDIYPSHRTASCLRYARREGGFKTDGTPITRDIQIWKSLESGRAHYKNLTVCGRVWTCPVCTAKINEGRRIELKHICEAHQSHSGTILMVTKTFSHNRFDDLSEMLSGLSKANDRFWRCADIRRLRESLGLVGYIRTTEVTWGHANGWHPHYHELWLIKENCDLHEIKKTIFRKWRDFIEKSGLGSPNEDYGIHVRGADDAWGYITKFGTEDQWDYSHEMTRHHVKKSKSGSFTPFTLLAASNPKLNSSDIDSDYAKKLFIEYADAIHGKRQLQYSKGLKSLYDIQEIDDQELAETMDQSAMLLATLDTDSWLKILWSDKKKTARATALVLAEQSLDALHKYIEGLPDPPVNYFP